jgi:uncharacterized protein (TIGR03437 family)
MSKHLFSAAALSAVLLLPVSAQELRESSEFIERRSRTFHRGRLVKEKPGAASAARRSAIEKTKSLPIAPGFDSAWKNIGPRPTIVLDNATSGGPPIASGRVTAVAVDPRGAGDVVYLGAAHGGVWKTVDAGRNWTPLTDDQPTLAIGSLAIDPSRPDTVYAGTGEENFLDFDNYFGSGILKTEDGGKTWNLLASEQFGGPVSAESGGARIGAIVVHPKDSRVLLAAVDGRKGQHSGIYRSEDAGVSWKNVLDGAPGTSVVFDPLDPATVYAGLGDTSDHRASGVYKSTDGGLTWNRSQRGIPAGIGRVTLTISAAKPAILYAAIASTKTDPPLGVFKTVDGGATWTSANGPDYCDQYCWWANTIQVSPRDPNLVLVAGLEVYLTRDGGKSWSLVSRGVNGNFIHWDVHAIVFGPSAGVVYVGTDGGMYRADNIGDPTATGLGWNNINDTLSLTQFYPGCSGQVRQTDFIVCGTQDNGVQIFTGGSTWRMIDGGDGGFTAIDTSRPSIFYFSEAGNVGIYKSSPFTSFKGFLQAISGLGSVNSDDCFLAPLAIDPAFPQRLYYGCRGVFRTNDGGGNWRAVSPNLPKGQAYTFLAVSPGSSARVYAAATDGKVYVTDNATAAPATLTWRASTDLPARGISSVVADPRNPDIAFATAHGFSGFQDNLGHVFKTTDAGKTWRDISGDLPNIPANIISLDPDNPHALFVGTDIGVFRSPDGGASWFSVGTGLPRVPVVSLRLHADGHLLRAATHGRGMWELPLPVLPQALVTLRVSSGAMLTRGLRLTGFGFTSGTVARWNGDDRKTTFLDSRTLEVALTAADRRAGRTTVSVRDTVSGVVSNTVDVQVAEPPVIQRLDNGAFAGPAPAGPLAACPAKSGVTLTAGMVATIRGFNLSPVTARISPSAVGQTLGGAIVEFRSTSAHESYIAPILFVSPTRIDFQVPPNAPLGPNLQMDLVQGMHMSQKVCVTIGKFNPGLFSVNQLGTGQGSVTNVADGKLAAPAGRNARPAKKGELVQILATGLGPFWQEPGNKPLDTIATPQIQIGGLAAEVTLSEAQQPFAGTYAVTVRIPANSPSGPAIPVLLTAGGLQSNSVTIAVE